MCGGASGGEKALSAETGNFYRELHGAYNEQFGKFKSILSNLHDAWTPVLNGGINQQGFSADERAARNSSAINSTATNYQHASQAVNEQLAERGGGNVALPTGSVDSINAGIATNAAQDLSNKQNEIVREDYATGRQNFMAASGALSGVAGQENPLGFAGAAGSEGDQAFKMENQIQAQNNSWKNDLIGGITGIAGSWATGGFKLPGSGSSGVHSTGIPGAEFS
jgi:hypothetical protein